MNSVDKPFWETLADRGNAVAMEHPESGQSWTYRVLAGHVSSLRDSVSRGSHGVAFVFGENDFGGIVSYLGCLLAGHAVYLFATKVHHPAVRTLIERYRPELILSRLTPSAEVLDGHYSPHSTAWNYQIYVRDVRDDPAPNPDLGLLLSTSASTGNPKTVRLARSALAASTLQVIDALHITSTDHAVTSLPFTHVYGLSVINSHLAAGARISLEKRSVSDAAFWSGRARSPWTTLAGVTVTYELLRQRGMDLRTLGGLRKLLHSGSRMPTDVFSWLYSNLDPKQTQLYMMYGQTEACGRMSVLQPQMLPDSFGSVGKPVRGGRITLSAEQEVIYSGPNVMLGYADGRTALTVGDEMHGILHTGDRGRLDADGMLSVIGRSGRICKLFGQRVCLDDIEEFFHTVSPTAALCQGENILLFSEAAEMDLRRKLVSLAKTFRLPPQNFVLHKVPKLPRTAAGKISYHELGTLRGESA